MSDAVSVRYVQGRAEVQAADYTLVVRRRDAPGGPTCPVDLVTAALGS